MADFILKAHSGWRYLVIAIVAVALVKFLIGWLTNGKWSRLDQGLGAATPIMMDIQLLLGLVLWVMQQRWISANPLASWEHPVTMILAIAAGHIGWSRAKKSADAQVKYRTATIWFAVALILIGLGVWRITHQGLA